jgi:hypothetical protein
MCAVVKNDTYKETDEIIIKNNCEILIYKKFGAPSS